LSLVLVAPVAMVASFVFGENFRIFLITLIAAFLPA
jgi:hypothetical protein